MDYQKNVFPNGLTLLTVPMKGVASVTVLVMVGVGSRHEEKNINGLSHFLEHMAFKGTEKRPSALAIASTIDGIGADFNAFTTKDHTGYYIKAATKHLPLVLDVLTDMLLHSKFDPEEIEKERGVIIEEINMYEDTPMRKIGDLYENLMYGDTKLGRDIAGRKEVIKKVTKQDFISYVDRFYTPSNTVVTIAGGLETYDPQSLQAMVGQYFGGWEKKEPVDIERFDKVQTAPQVMVHYKDTQQAHIALGVPSYHLNHPNRYKLSVMSAILGGGMSSRLFIEVREKRGLAYYVRSSNEQYEDVGNFVTQAGVDVARIDDAVKVIAEQLMKMKDEGVTEEELSKAKEYLKGRFTLDLEDSKSVASLFASTQLLEDHVRTPEEILESLDEVESKHVQEVAADIFKKDQFNLAVVGPYKEEERFKKLLE